VRRPFVPEFELPNPTFGADSYAIVIAPTDETSPDEPVIYEDGETILCPGWSKRSRNAQQQTQLVRTRQETSLRTTLLL